MTFYKERRTIQFSEDLISTKILVPPLKESMIERRHLLQKLSKGKRSPLIAIQGVAGSGKTSLLCQWLKTEKISAVWYSLDEADNEDYLFYRYLTTAFTELHQHPDSGFSDRFTGGNGIDRHQVVSRLLRYLAEFKTDIYMVFDDFHCISSKKIIKAFIYFLSHLPQNLHVILSMRYNTNIPLTAFKVKNQVMEITAEELLLKEEEAHLFYSKVVPLDLTKEQVNRVWRYTEGWIGGLQLFGLYHKGNQTSRDFEANIGKLGRETSSYLLNEVFDAQPEDIKKFIEKTALLDRFNIDIANEITDSSNAAKIIDRLMKINLFITCLDSENMWFRYHNIFSMAIRDRIKTLGNVEFVEIYRQASICFAGREYLEDAFSYAFSSGDMEFAADILENYLIVLYERYDISSFKRWLARLPQSIFMQRPLLRLLECRYQIEYNQAAEAGNLIRDIESQKSELFARYDNYRKRLCEDHLLLIKFFSCFWADPFKVNAKELQETLDRISQVNKGFSGMAMIIMATIYLFKDDIRKAYDTIREATNMVMSSESLRAKVLWYNIMAMIERSRGRLHIAKGILERGFSLLEKYKCNDYDIAGAYILHSSMGWIYYLRNELEKAMEHVSAALEYRKDKGTTWEAVEVISISSLAALVHEARKETGMINFYREKIQMTARASGNRFLIDLIDVSNILLSLQQGNIRDAERWAGERRISSDMAVSAFKSHEYLALGQMFCAKGQYEEAIDMLKNVHRHYESQGLKEKILEVDLLICQALYALNRTDEASAIMEDLLDFSESEGYIRPFLDQAKGISRLLAHIVRKAPYLGERPNTALILEGCNIEYDTLIKKGNRTNDECLTPKEIEILKLLAIGYTYMEIGEKSFVSINTIRTHIKHIYCKLEVGTKTKAIRRAEALGLL